LILLAHASILHADNVGSKAREKRGTRAIASAQPAMAQNHRWSAALSPTVPG